MEKFHVVKSKLMVDHFNFTAKAHHLVTNFTKHNLYSLKNLAPHNSTENIQVEGRDKHMTRWHNGNVGSNSLSSYPSLIILLLLLGFFLFGNVSFSVSFCRTKGMWNIATLWIVETESRENISCPNYPNYKPSYFCCIEHKQT